MILYDWFYPGFRAGGPIQSLTNLTEALIPEFEIYVVTGAFDLNADVPYGDVIINSWNDVSLPGTQESIKVFYAGRKIVDKKFFCQLLSEIAPAIVYLNGIFSYRYFLLPLLAVKKIKESKVIVCPRGMLKKGALSAKAFKKKIYINYLKAWGLLNKVYWHATTSEEADDIALHFPVNKGVIVAPNIPKPPCSSISFIPKKKGELKVIYLSLINEHKNLLLLLQLIKQVNVAISLDIYGPVVDEAYWTRCKALVKQMPGKVQYKGQVQPVEVQEVLAQYHSLILLTKGENFGHALYESLSVGRPAITSSFTPWQNLYEKRAGANVNIENMDDCMKKINTFASMEQDQYDAFCKGAHAVAINYYTNLDIKETYRQLFSMM
ncbi:MAG: hypothetical protein JWQ09_4260 [Segetibacter sp.]|nr:hypothetical protein [Segetibacter sp.]